MNDAQLGGGPVTGGLVELLDRWSLAEEVVVGAVPQVAQPRHGLGHGMIQWLVENIETLHWFSERCVYSRVLQM